MTNEIFNCYWYGITRSESQSRKFPSIQDFKSPGTWAPSPLCPRPRWRCVYLEPEPLFRSVPGHVGAVSTWHLSPFSALSPAPWVLCLPGTWSPSPLCPRPRGCCLYLEPEPLLRSVPCHVGAQQGVHHISSTQSSLVPIIKNRLCVSNFFLSKASDGVPGCRRLFCKVFQFVYQGLHAVISCLLQHTLKWKCGVNGHDHSRSARKIVLQYFHIWL